MHYLCCLFDYRRNPPRPLYAVSHDSDTKDVEFYQLYQPGTKYSLFEVNQNLNKIKSILLDKTVVLSDFHSFISAFKLDLNRSYDVYDLSLPKEASVLTIPLTKKKLLTQLSTLIKAEPLPWQQILANSQLVYNHLEKVGFYHNGKKCHPIYDLAYSGRSKCLMHNIQGANAEDAVHHINDEFDVFVHFDWVAADFRVASLVSNDKYLKESFKTSDPYTAIYKELDSDAITRDQCKIELFKSLYSMNTNEAILEYYPTFTEWMAKSSMQIEMDGFSHSILNRKFSLEEDRTIKSVFNAQIQGSVAHAMQNTLFRVFKIYQENILTEIHDSLVLCCKQADLKGIIETVANIMLWPFEDVLDENPKFPLKVSVGTKWKHWKLFKEYR